MAMALDPLAEASGNGAELDPALPYCTKVHIDGTNVQLHAHRRFCILKPLRTSIITDDTGATMNTAFRFTLSFLIIIFLAGLTFATTAGDEVDLAEFACHPEAFAGRNIEVKAK